MFISLDEFKKYFNKSFWYAICKNSLFPLELSNDDKQSIVTSLHESILKGTYRPSAPREYIINNKGNYIARLISVFEPRDICLYYFCTKQLQEEIAINRISNTYGGWKLGGDIRKQEEDEIEFIKDHFVAYETPDGTEIVMDESEDYSFESSFNPLAWKTKWKDFNQKLYLNSRSNDHAFMVEMDIANFYDSIRLDRLEEKIKVVAPRKIEIINLLFRFLRGIGSVGIPQEESVDCSRILANFYLQEYDGEISTLCNEFSGKYFRYADDQVVFAQSEKVLREFIFKASIIITRFGLSINQKKVRIMRREDFEEYYSFDWFMKLQEKNSSSEDIISAINYYSKNKDKLRNNGVGLLLKLLHIISGDLKEAYKRAIIDDVLDDKFLNSHKFDGWQIEKVLNISSESERKRIIKQLSSRSSEFVHNHYHLILKRLFKKIKIPYDDLEKRIEELRVFYKV